MNPMQKHPHIIEFSDCILNMSPFMFLFPINFLISSGTSGTPKVSKQTISFSLQNKAIYRVPISAYSSTFITQAPYFTSFGKLSIEKNAI